MSEWRFNWSRQIKDHKEKIEFVEFTIFTKIEWPGFETTGFATSLISEGALEDSDWPDGYFLSLTNESPEWLWPPESERLPE